MLGVNPKDEELAEFTEDKALRGFEQIMKENLLEKTGKLCIIIE